MYIFDDQLVLVGEREVIGFGKPEFFVRELEREKANDIILKNHYSKKFYNVSTIHLGVYMESKLVGVLQYGYALNPQSMGGVVAGTAVDEYLELNRMWLSDEAPRNSESRAISYSMKFIKKKYPKIKWVQSFADERCSRFGVVYQAANFFYLGEHEAIFWEWEGTWYHNIIMTAKRGKQGSIGLELQANKDKATRHVFRQFRYIYFIKRSAMKGLKLKIQDYPKHPELNAGEVSICETSGDQPGNGGGGSHLPL